MKKRKSGRKQAPAERVSSQRKQEVLGLVTLVLGVLFMLAVLTYSPDDTGRFSWDSLLDPGSSRVDNWLGLTGAAIARLLVPSFLGYCVLLFPAAALGWGYLWLRNRVPVFMPLLTWLAGLGAYAAAALIGWFGQALEFDAEAWAGALGMGTAGWMTSVFGSVGSLILLVLILTVIVLLAVDLDIQRSIDRVESGLASLRGGFRTRWDRFVARHEERKAMRQAARAERRSRQQEPPRSPEPPPRPKPPPPSPPVDPPPSSGREDPLPTADDVEGDAIPVTKEEPHVEERTTRTPASAQSKVYRFQPPGLDLLDAAPETERRIDEEEIEDNQNILLDKLDTYNIEITAINSITGPTVTRYELTPAAGVKISRITALENDLAMAMAARGIRMIAPIPGKTAIGVEVPNRHRELVRIRDVIGTAKFRNQQMELPLIFGKSIEGEVVLQDLTKQPHVLIAGATGSGKSVGLNTFIAGLLYACPPEHLKFVMIDPKKIELQMYNRIAPHYAAMPPQAEHAIITDVAEALGTLRSCEREMENRYDLLRDAQVRSLKDYNQKFTSGALDPEDHPSRLPYIVVIVDELADLMMTAGKEIEAPIARLAQMARAVGIHLILATQRPSVDVITGLIKANFPARVAYQVASKIDSRTILDQNGAEGLVGNGDLLYMLGSRITRLQGPFVSIDEVDRLTDFIGEQPGPGPYLLPPIETDEAPGPTSSAPASRDDLFEEAAQIIVRSQQGSVSLLQRKLSVGYSRAARIVDQLEDAGIVGPFEGSKARQVRVPDETELQRVLAELS